MSRSLVLSQALSASLADYAALTKPRISLLVTLTGAVGYVMASRAGLGGWGLIHTMIGTALVSGAANTLNQVLERTPDAQMRRTANRPLPAGRVRTESAVAFATLLGVAGIAYCGLLLNLLTAAVALVTLASYAFVYTPLKRRTTLNTLVGAIPGALPPVGGWVAASGGFGWGAAALFLILFFWQIPHFLSIAWILRADYARAGFRMMTVDDVLGSRTGAWMAGFGLGLIPVALLPTLFNTTGWTYGIGAGVASALYAWASIRAARRLDTRNNRWLFVASLLYLPAILILMIVDKSPV
jgi:protoheme IX farnesyltransferase